MVDKGTLAFVMEIIEVVLETAPSPVLIIPHESRHFQNSNALKLGATPPSASGSPAPDADGSHCRSRFH
jgi:hypothetical protein